MQKKNFIVYYTIRSISIWNILLSSGHQTPTSSKRTSRIAAVQTAYQQSMTDDCFEKSIKNFIEYYISSDELYSDINLFFYKKLTSHLSVAEKENTINEIIKDNLYSGNFAVLNNILVQNVIKIATVEMVFENTDIPIVINEFLEIAKEFVEPKSIKFINAILDKISKKIERKLTSCPPKK